MTSGEFREIAKLMQEFGIVHVKMGDCEIVRNQEASQKEEISPSRLSQQLTPIPAGITTSPENPIQHKVDHLTSLMKLSDRDLIDQLFPDKTEEESA